MTEGNNHEQNLSRIEQRLTEAFRAHAASVKPSADAYRRLALLVEQDDGGRHRWNLPLMIRPLGFVATLVAVVGLGGYLLALQGPQAVQSVTGAPAVVDPSAVVDGDEAESAGNADQGSGGSNGDDEVDADLYRVEGAGVDLADAVGEGEATEAGSEGTESPPGRRLEGLTYAPVGATAVDAAERFLDLLGITGVEVLDTPNTIDDSTDASDDPVLLDVRKLLGDGNGSGDGPILTTLVVAPIGGAFVVEEARSLEYDFAFVESIDDDPTDDGIDDPVTLIDPVAVQLSNSKAQSYSIELKPVLPGDGPSPSGTRPRAVSAIVGASRVWVVVSGSSAKPGPFSAKPAYVLGADDTSSYTAVGLPPDDRDGGLVLRSRPNGERVGVIGLGSDGVRRRSVAPRLTDGLVWWAVTAPDGREGWVASGHLAANDPIDDAILVDLAGRLAGTFEGPPILKDEVGFAYPVYVGPITRPTLVKRGLDIPASWSVARAFRAETGTGNDAEAVEVSLAEFLRTSRWGEAEILVPDGYLDPAAQRAAKAYFGALPSVALETVDPETGLRERVHVFVSHRNPMELDLGELSVFGIVLEAEPAAEDAGQVLEPSGPKVTAPEEPTDDPPSGDDEGGDSE